MMERLQSYLRTICFALLFSLLLSQNITAYEYTRPVIRESMLSWSSWHAYCCIINRNESRTTEVVNSEIRNVLKVARQNRKWAKKIVRKLKLNKVKRKKAVSRICRYIDDNFTYDSSQGWLEMAIKTKRANCTAYADLFYVLCKAAKIPVRFIRGDVNNGVEYGSHCWNQVKIKRKWYWVDSCWGYRPSQTLWATHLRISELW